MIPLIRTNCEEPWNINFEHHSWPNYVNLLVLFATFIAISLDITYRRSRSYQVICRHCVSIL